MSKELKIIGLLIILGVLSISILFYKKDIGQKKISNVAREVEIKQTSTAIDVKTYEDWAGFSFNYPNLLTVKEIELDDDSIYSSLELINNKGEKMSLRISDTKYKDFDEWKEKTEKTEILKEIRHVLWANLEATQLEIGVPTSLITVALEDNVLYKVKSPSDNGGFWEQTHQSLIETFKFNSEVFEEEVSGIADPESTTSSGIVLLEETLE